jgi:molybdate-binding protein/transcriptional regulator with XRE-family HTH domain
MTLVSHIRAARLQQGLSQAELAAAIGLSRQALSSLEAGRAVPRTDVALGLARALGTTVEALFSPTAAPPRVQARVSKRLAMDTRVLLANVNEGWVAHCLGRASLQPGDGVIRACSPSRATIEPLGPLERARERLVVMGCAPALGLLSARLSDARVPVAWLQGTSPEALQALERGEVHIAGIHLRDGEVNVREVERRFKRSAVLVTFASWEQGLVVAKGNPLGLRTVDDLRRPRVRLVRREPGAGATRLLEQLGGAGLRPTGPLARGHLEVAEAVSLGAADAGVAIRAAAIAYELDFLPLSAERFDLVIPRALKGDARVERLIDELSSGSFRRELDAVGGYETRDSGRLIER